MTTSQNEAGIYETERGFLSHWGKGKADPVAMMTSHFGSGFEIEGPSCCNPANVQKVKAHGIVPYCARASIDDVDVINSNHTAI